jgi:hypothetical protein
MPDNNFLRALGGNKNIKNFFIKCLIYPIMYGTIHIKYTAQITEDIVHKLQKR